jgi:hypothetical protein
VTGNDILIGKTAALPERIIPGMEQRKKKRDASSGMRPQEKGIVDKVMLSTNKNGQKFVKVRGRATRLRRGALLAQDTHTHTHTHTYMHARHTHTHAHCHARRGGAGVNGVFVVVRLSACS